MPNEFTSLKREGSISIITMDDGKGNAFSSAMTAAFNDCLRDVPKDSGALVITGRGKIFSGGFDLKTINSGDEEARKSMSIAGLTLLADIFGFPRPVVIACNGHAVALGAFFLLAGDYRIGADGDFRIWANEIGNGMTIPKAVLEITKIRIKQSHWYRAILHSEPYPIQEAIAPGYLDEVVPQETLMNAALAKAEELAKLPHPFYAITKEWTQTEVLQRIRSTIG
jgi:enoyl-CoA hydratase